MAGQQQGVPISSARLVELRDLLALVVEQAHSGIQSLSEKLPGQPDQDRKRALLLHLHATRQRLQRLHAVVAWSHKSRAVKECSLILQATAAHNAALSHAADQLFHLHGELSFMAAPAYDVGTALHVMQTGGYSLLPSVVEEGLQRPPPQHSESARSAALARMDRLLRSKLLAEDLPPGLRVLRVGGGQAHVEAAGGQYTARLSLTPAPSDNVVLARYQPPAEAEAEPTEQQQQQQQEGAAKEQPEVTQQQQQQQQQQQEGVGREPEAAPAAVACADATGGPSSSAGAPTGAGSKGAGREADGWRWQLMTLELLPALERGRDPRLVPQPHTIWLRQHTQERMMAAADVQQLQRLGKHHWVAMPPSKAAGAGSSRGKRAPAGSDAAPATPTPSASAAPAASSLARSSAAGAPQQQLQQQEGQQGGAERGSEGQLPPWASSPLLLMHLALQQAAARVALYNHLLPQARELAAGGWPAGVKVDRPEGGGGIRLSYWQQVPWLTHAELEALRATPSSSAAAAGAGAAAPTAAQPPTAHAGPPAIEVLLREEATQLACVAVPPLQQPHSGAEATVEVDLRSSSCSAEQLLLAAASLNAATQLAGLQAVLQRDGRLAAARAAVELVLPSSQPAAATGAGGGWNSSSSSSAGSGQQAAAPMLQVWWQGQVQLGVSIQLRSARLLLTPGPGILEAAYASSSSSRGGTAGGGEGAAVSALIALVEAAQQQLDRLQRDIFSRPLPPGCTRGMLFARLAAGIVSELLLRLAMHHRLDAMAARAAAAGLHRSALPPALLQQHLRRAAAPAIVPASLDNSLLLALSAFPAPPDLRRLAAAGGGDAYGPSSLSSSGGGGSSSGGSTQDCGAVSCHLLVSLNPASGPLPAEAQEQQQPAGANQLDIFAAAEPSAAAQARPSVQLSMALVVCATTSRGTATRVLRVVPVPASAAAAAAAARAGSPAAGASGQQAGSRAPQRKRTRDSQEGEQLAEPGGAVQPDRLAGNRAGAGADAEEALDLAAVSSWCRRQALWEQLLAQLHLLQLPFLEEFTFPSSSSSSSSSGSNGTVTAPRPVLTVRLAQPQGLQGMDNWLAAQSGSKAGGGSNGNNGPHSNGSSSRAEVYLRLGSGPAAEAEGAWSMEAHSMYLARLPQLCRSQGVAVSLPAGGVQLREWGASYHYSLQRGDSALTAVTDLFACIRMHTCLVRIWDLIASSPYGHSSSSSQQQHLANGGSYMPAGSDMRSSPTSPLANGRLWHDSSSTSTGSKRQSTLVWVLPGCGEVTLEQVGLSHMVLSVGSPPPMPDELLAGSPAPPLRLTVCWASKLTVAAAAAETSHGRGASAAAGAAAAATAAGAAAKRMVQCSISAEPALPESFTASLAARLEAGCERDFLDALCTAGHAAALAQQWLLCPDAQRSAGLLPGALLPAASASANGSAGAGSSAPSPFLLAFRLRQAGRSLRLTLQFSQAGFTLLRLAAPAERLAPGSSASVAWVDPLWQRLQSMQGVKAVESVAPAKASGGSAKRVEHAAWCHWEGLGAVLSTVLQAVAGVT